MMEQTALPDLGVTKFRTAPCPDCGRDVFWSIAEKYNATVRCPNTGCKFKARRAEWDYIRDKGLLAWSAQRKIASDRRERRRAT